MRAIFLALMLTVLPALASPVARECDCQKPMEFVWVRCYLLGPPYEDVDAKKIEGFLRERERQGLVPVGVPPHEGKILFKKGGFYANRGKRN